MSTKRAQWEDLPVELRSEIEHRVGAPVLLAVTQPGGFTPGTATLLTHVNGTTTFVKAIPVEDNLFAFYEHEALINSQMPPAVPAPRLLFSFTGFGWLVLCFEAILGRNPHQPWQRHELDTALVMLGELVETLTPSPIEDLPRLEDSIGDNHMDVFVELEKHGRVDGVTLDLLPDLHGLLPRIAELNASWAEATRGETMIHFDVRADNMVFDHTGKMYLVDWAWPCKAATFVDLITFLPSTNLPPEEMDLCLIHPAMHGTSKDQVNSWLAALAGSYLHDGTRPVLHHAPTLRAFQYHSGITTLEWLLYRLRA